MMGEPDPRRAWSSPNRRRRFCQSCRLTSDRPLPAQGRVWPGLRDCRAISTRPRRPDQRQARCPQNDGQHAATRRAPSDRVLERRAAGPRAPAARSAPRRPKPHRGSRFHPGARLAAQRLLRRSWSEFEFQPCDGFVQRLGFALYGAVGRRRLHRPQLPKQRLARALIDRAARFRRRCLQPGHGFGKKRIIVSHSAPF